MGFAYFKYPQIGRISERIEITMYHQFVGKRMVFRGHFKKFSQTTSAKGKTVFSGNLEIRSNFWSNVCFTAWMYQVTFCNSISFTCLLLIEKWWGKKKSALEDATASRFLIIYPVLGKQIYVKGISLHLSGRTEKFILVKMEKKNEKP